MKKRNSSDKLKEFFRLTWGKGIFAFVILMFYLVASFFCSPIHWDGESGGGYIYICGKPVADFLDQLSGLGFFLIIVFYVLSCFVFWIVKTCRKK